MAESSSLHGSGPITRPPPTPWAAYAACGLALLSAVPSFYWALGGTAGLDTVGGTLEELGRARDPRGVALGWVPGSSRSPGGCWPWPWHARAVPRRLLLGAAWAASTVLTAYGGLLVVVGALVLTGVISPSGPVDRTALRWHVMVWDLWFFLWGLLLGVAHLAPRSPVTGSRRRIHGLIDKAMTKPMLNLLL